MVNDINLRKTNYLVFISFFPVFIFRSNLNINEIIYTLLIFIGPILLMNYLIFKKKLLNRFFFISYLSLVIVYGIDNHLGMWNGFVLPFKHKFINIFGILYIPGLILFISLSLLIGYLLLIGKDKFYRIILVFLFTIFVFGIFDKTKSHKNINSFVNESSNRYLKTNLVMVFDEMAGMNSFESANDEKSKTKSYLKRFFRKHGFEFYSDVVSITRNTGASLSALLNFSEDKTTRAKTLIKSPSYFFEYELTKNLLFDKYKNISVYQNTHIDFCNYAHVSKCESFNPFIKKEFLNGFKDTFLSKIISIWKLNGSISSIVVWRSFRQLRIIDSILEPEGHKATFISLFKSLEKDITSKKYDLIFVHTLVPHRPYGFDAECNYDGSLSVANRYFTVEKMVKQHNLEKRCTFFYLDAFLENLKEKNYIDKVDLTILSDHGARIKKTKDSRLPSIFAFKNIKTTYKENKEKKILQELFTEHLK